MNPMKKNYPDYRDRIVMHEVVKAVPKEQMQIIDDFMNHLGTTAGYGKIKDYRRYFIQFYDVVEKPLSELTPQDIVNFSALVNQDQRLGNTTKNTIKNIIKRFIDWKYSEDFGMNKVKKNLRAKFMLVNQEKINKGNLIKPEEIELLLRCANSTKVKAQLITLYETACRPHELRGAKWCDIDWSGKLISVYATKTSKARQLPIREALVHLKRWKEEFQYPDVKENDFIFPSPLDRTKPIGRSEFTYWITSLGKKAGISRRIYPYLIRHTRLTELYKKGVPDQIHKLFAGHSKKSDMTGVYVSMDNEDMIQSVVSKVYHVEELPLEKKLELELKISEQQKVIDSIPELIQQELQKALEWRKDFVKTMRAEDKSDKGKLKIVKEHYSFED